MERWIHVDCKYMAPAVAALSEDLVAWARAGATGILFEWENMFPYPGLEGAVRPDAYTPAEIRGLLALCRDSGLKAVPLVQTLGHLEWMLAGPRFSHLREFPERPALIRACDPETMNILAAKIATLLDLHHESPYLHLGGDEARGLDQVDRPGCSSVQDGAASIYLRHMRPLLDQVIRAGKRPILWADMPLRNPDRLREFPRETVFCDWRYNATSEHDSSVTEWAFNSVCRETLTRIPADRRALFERYWMIGAPDDPQQFYQFPYTPFLRDQGFDVLGASASMWALMPLAGPVLPSVRANARHWIGAIDRHDGLGVINTCWAVRGALREASLPAHRAFLRMASAPGAVEDDACVSRAAWASACGARAGEVAAAVDALAPPLDPLSRTHPHTVEALQPLASGVALRRRASSRPTNSCRTRIVGPQLAARREGFARASVDPVSGMNRAVPYDERWDGLKKELAGLAPSDPVVEDHAGAVRRAHAVEAALAEMPPGTDVSSWLLAGRETALRARIWLTCWHAARGESVARSECAELCAAIERQAYDVRAFMEGRYRAADLDIVQTDRYAGLLRLVKRVEGKG